jgi:Fe-S cluster assembly iron-binding protein IscA
MVVFNCNNYKLVRSGQTEDKMKVQTTNETVEAIKKVIEGQPDRPATVRIFLAGFGCSGPSFGLALDDKTEDDIVDDSEGVAFVMSKEILDTYGEFKIDFVESGYLVAPINQQPSECGSCGSGCGSH